MRDVFIVLMRAYFGVSFVLYGISKLNGLAGTTASFAGLGIPLPFIAVPLVGELHAARRAAPRRPAAPPR